MPDFWRMFLKLKYTDITKNVLLTFETAPFFCVYPVFIYIYILYIYIYIYSLRIENVELL